jgi:hypothetical protein
VRGVSGQAAWRSQGGDPAKRDARFRSQRSTSSEHMCTRVCLCVCVFVFEYIHLYIPM